MMYDYANPTGDVARPGDFRDPIAHALELQRQQQQRRRQQPQSPQQPFAQPMPMQQLSRPTQPAPMIGTPQSRPQEASPYGFQSGFNAAMGSRADYPNKNESGWSDLYHRFTDSFGPQGSEWT